MIGELQKHIQSHINNDLVKKSQSLHLYTSLNAALTLCTDDPGSLPVTVGPATNGRDVALEEAFGALVADHCMDVIMGPPPANQVGVLDCWWASTQHWQGVGVGVWG